jgi:hypothetical protein
MDWLTLLLLMFFLHALADYPLQGDFLSKAKNRANPIPGVPWYQGLLAHSAIQGGFVGLATGSVLLALFEFVVHILIDDAKCMGRFSYNTDQALHLLCKVIWIVLLWKFGTLPAWA